MARRTPVKNLIYALLLFTAAANATQPTPPEQLTAEQTASQLRSLFFDASREGNNPMLDTFIEAHYDLNVRDEQGYTGLILAAYHGHEDSVTKLIDAGADPCAKDNRGNTALMGAIFKGELSIAKRLVQADCGPDLTNNAGQTAAMYAALFKRTEVLKALTDKGADLNIRDSMGNDVQGLSKGEFQALPAR
ncbi:Ankyrin domain-containing protein [Pseudomonas coronafaciens pv. atropurpurea]|nr:Ankyrin domain-containing protein [Pseudomonas coronafaciens pv. atropurpurea]RMT59006.1 Ankyrin domain-containing protein [Pseudomonas coronafaciens pv. atropurpurea]